MFNKKTFEYTKNTLDVCPQDEYNSLLISNVHPLDWVNPKPAPSYNIVVIGAGPAGLVTAAGAAMLGAKVALVEKNLLGGDCLNVGCVPSKAIIRSSRAYADIQEACELGVRVNGSVDVDFAAVMRRMRRLRADISHHDAASRFRDLGIDVFLGQGKFSSPDTIEVGRKILCFKKAVIATGARAAELPIEGLRDTGYLTNETVFSLTKLPKRLLVLGGGPIGCELAQAFCRLGSDVTIVEISLQILGQEDPTATNILTNKLRQEGITLKLGSSVNRVTRSGNEKNVYINTKGLEEVITVDEILLGVGRTPNLEGLNLEVAGVKYEKKGIVVNEYMQTSNSRVYAAGDICMAHKFTHAADAAARIVIQNALFLGYKKLSSLTIPWCTYTDPEIAHVGIYEKTAQEKGIAIDTFSISLDQIDRAIVDGEKEGFVKIYVKKGTDKILGATIVARHAGEMIGEIMLAMTKNIGLSSIATVIHPYPTQAEAIRRVADEYNRTKLTPFVKKILAHWLAFTR